MSYEFAVLLARIPLDVAVPLTIGVAVLISVIGTWVVNTVYAPFQLEPNNLVGGVKFTFLGEVYAVTLAVALIGAFDRYTDAPTPVQTEGAPLAPREHPANAYARPAHSRVRAATKSAAREDPRARAEEEGTPQRRRQ